jgi:hypothetical protein
MAWRCDQPLDPTGAYIRPAAPGAIWTGPLEASGDAGLLASMMRVLALGWLRSFGPRNRSTTSTWNGSPQCELTVKRLSGKHGAHHCSGADHVPDIFRAGSADGCISSANMPYGAPPEV